MKIKIRDFFNNKMVDPYTYRNDSDNGTVLHYLISENKNKTIELVIKKEPKLYHLINTSIVNIPNDKKQTPLMLAISEKNKKIIDLLSEYGACWDVADIEGKTAYHYYSANYENDFKIENLIKVKSAKKNGVILIKNQLINEDIVNAFNKIKEHSIEIDFIKTYSDLNKFDASLIPNSVDWYVGERSSVSSNIEFEYYLGSI